MDIRTQDTIRLDAWRGVFEKTNRILSEQRVTVQIVPEERLPFGMEEIPGWTDGLDIHLNGKKVREMLSVRDPMAAVLRLKGLNYHELCHVLYTPRMTDDLPKAIVKRAEANGDTTWWYAFNALEDQRIETWFTATFGASRRYFEATVLEWIIKEGNAEAAILLYGRKYLSPKVRVQVGRVFAKKYGRDLYGKFQQLIDEYISLMLPTDSVKAEQVIVKFHALLKEMQQKQGATLPPLIIKDNGSHDGCPGRSTGGVARAGRVYVRAARRDRDKAVETIQSSKEADKDEEARRESEAGSAQQGEDKGEQEQQASGSGDQNSGEQGVEGAGDGAEKSQDGQQGSQQGSGSSPVDGVGDGTSQGGTSSDQSSTADSQSESIGDGGAGAGGGAMEDHVSKDDKSLEDELRDMVDGAYDDIDKVREDEQVKQDVGNVLDAVKANERNGRMDAEGQAARGGINSPRERHTLAVRRVHTVLTRIRQEAEPETLRNQYHGRVDARRVVSRQPHEVDIFKTWDHGAEEETGVEAVLLVDVSGSMRGVMDEANAAMWVLKRAFDKLDIRTTVLIFDTDHSVLYQPSEKAHPNGIPNVHSGGGTNPSSAIEQAKHILTKSHTRNKVLITVTDGGWQANEDHYLRQMKSLHKIGVTTMLLGLARAKERHGKHGHMEGHDIQSISELPKVAVKLVANIMRNAERV